MLTVSGFATPSSASPSYHSTLTGADPDVIAASVKGCLSATSMWRAASVTLGASHRSSTMMFATGMR